ncbi:hypothetical protein [Flaviaesturariibacter terrae]
MIVLRSLTWLLFALYSLFALLSLLPDAFRSGNGGTWMAVGFSVFYLFFLGLLLVSAPRSENPRWLSTLAFFIALLPVGLLLFVLAMMSGHVC